MVCLSRDHERTPDLRTTWLNGKEPPEGKFDGHRRYGRGGKFLVCHLILQDHQIKGSCDFMGWSP